MKTFYLLVFLLFCSPNGILSQKLIQNSPQTPTEAIERAAEPINKWFQSKEATLEGNLKALKESEQLAKEYARLFRLNDWTEKELFSLARLYESAKQFADVEQALTVYLRNPQNDKMLKAKTMLLFARLAQKKFSASITIAEQLLDEEKYNQDIIFNVQLLIDALRDTDIKRSVALAEKRLYKLIKYAEDNIGNPGHAALVLNYALDLSSMYQEAGNAEKSRIFVSSFLKRFDSSPLAHNERIKQSVEATILRRNLIGTKAPAISGIEYIDMPKTSIAELGGKVIMLDFLAHWCAPCIASFPETNALKQNYEAKGLVIIGVTSYYGFFGAQENLAIPDELAALKKLKLQRDANFGFIVGPRMNEQSYGIAGLPAVALIDRRGRIRYIKQGADYKKEIEKIIQMLVAEDIRN